MKKYTIEQLTKIGGNEWTTETHHRFYFNNLAAVYGLKYNSHNSGNISSAKLNGKTLSNGKAKSLISDLDFAKLYFDFKSGEFNSALNNKELEQSIIDKIVNRIEIINVCFA